MIEIEKTADGSNTLFVPELDEHYHSVKGAQTESEHIFINMGFKYSNADEPKILEIGFGTGLNAFLTLLESEKMKRKVFYTSIEKYPLSEDTVHSLGYPEKISPGNSNAADEFYSLHTAQWNVPVSVNSFFTLEKIEGDYTTYNFRNGYDIIYFYAFALPILLDKGYIAKLFDITAGSYEETTGNVESGPFQQSFQYSE